MSAPTDAVDFAIKVAGFTLAVVLAGAALGRWLFGRGGKETAIDETLARLNKIADQFEAHLRSEQAKAVNEAFEKGRRAAWEAAIQARVEEMDETLEEMSRARYSQVRGTGGSSR